MKRALALLLLTFATLCPAQDDELIGGQNRRFPC